MTVKEIIKEIKHQLTCFCEMEEIPSLVNIIIEEVLQLNAVESIVKGDNLINQNQQDLIFKIIAQLKSGKPIQYITNKAYFYGLELYVDENVLIPRPETELLVYNIIDFINKSYYNYSKKINILDIGTGSGCIAIALAKNISHVHVTAIDISSEALKIAQGNAEKNDVAIDFMLKNILYYDFYNLPEFDVIVSNPPYVRDSEKTLMKSRVLDYEPHIALFVPDNEPLLFYKKIVDIASYKLVKDGMLIMEINENLSEETCRLFPEVEFNSIAIIKDFRGKNRIIKALKR